MFEWQDRAVSKCIGCSSSELGKLASWSQAPTPSDDDDGRAFLLKPLRKLRFAACHHRRREEGGWGGPASTVWQGSNANAVADREQREKGEKTCSVPASNLETAQDLRSDADVALPPTARFATSLSRRAAAAGVSTVFATALARRSEQLRLETTQEPLVTKRWLTMPHRDQLLVWCAASQLSCPRLLTLLYEYQRGRWSKHLEDNGLTTRFPFSPDDVARFLVR